MAAKQERKRKDNPQEEFHIRGKLQLEAAETLPEGMELRAYVFSLGGELLESEPIDVKKGTFKVPLELPHPVPVELIIGPEGDPQQIRKSTAYRQRIDADAWRQEEEHFLFEPRITLPPEIWRPWLPIRICVSGRVRKVYTEDGETERCPVPYVKVEIFDVDRVACLWPYLKDRWKLLPKPPVLRLPDLLLKEPLPRRRKPPFPPEPRPEPEPGPTPPSPEPGPYFSAPLPRPQNIEAEPTVELRSGGTPVGEMKTLSAEIAAPLQELTITSRLAPWRIFPHCFYSKQKICETTTDEQGRFQCCFYWWPFYIRWGRLRYDARPDIIVRITQVIDGVEEVIYLDPYTSTRWNVTWAYLDLELDDPRIRCGSGDQPDRPAGTTVFFTRVGDDEVYDIDQSTGLYDMPGSLIKDVAYGHRLNIYAQFGDTLSRHIAAGGATPPYYYRLSYTTDGINFTPLTRSLEDTRVNKFTLYSESHTLGPVTVGGEPALYEIRDFGSYYWYNPDLINVWPTHAVEDDTDTYTLRLEIFDANGNALGSSIVDYRDGTHPPNGTLPTMTDRCDLILTVDNKPPVLDLQIPAVINDCGVIPWSPTLSLNFGVNVTQENNRLRMWRLEYTKGVVPTPITLASSSSATGALSPVHTTINGNSLLAGLTTTCAFAVKLLARPHIRNGRHFIYYREQIKSIAIEKCKPCPPPKP